MAKQVNDDGFIRHIEELTQYNNLTEIVSNHMCMRFHRMRVYVTIYPQNTLHTYIGYAADDCVTCLRVQGK